jgi:thiamine monophosphate kinase
MQVQTDPFLGWTNMDGRDYLVRQLNDHKGSIEITDLAGDKLAAYAQVCGELLARSHARSGDPVVLAGYLGEGKKFAEAIAEFGNAYAELTVNDWEDLKKAGVA